MNQSFTGFVKATDSVWGWAEPLIDESIVVPDNEFGTHWLWEPAPKCSGKMGLVYPAGFFAGSCKEKSDRSKGLLGRLKTPVGRVTENPAFASGFLGKAPYGSAQELPDVAFGAFKPFTYGTATDSDASTGVLEAVSISAHCYEGVDTITGAFSINRKATARVKGPSPSSYGVIERWATAKGHVSEPRDFTIGDLIYVSGGKVSTCKEPAGHISGIMAGGVGQGYIQEQEDPISQGSLSVVTRLTTTTANPSRFAVRAELRHVMQVPLLDTTSGYIMPSSRTDAVSGLLGVWLAGDIRYVPPSVGHTRESLDECLGFTGVQIGFMEGSANEKVFSAGYIAPEHKFRGAGREIKYTAQGVIYGR